MKVYIGPYPKNLSKERTVNVRIDKYDTWNLDTTLAVIILPLLKQLRDTKHGAPNTDNDDVPKRLRTKSKKKHITDKNFFKRWDWILGEMIWSFEQLTIDWADQYYSGKSDIWVQPLDKKRNQIGKPRKLGSKKDKETEDDAAWYELKKGPKDTFKLDVKGYQKHIKRMKNGFRLFGKYYMDFWD